MSPCYALRTLPTVIAGNGALGSQGLGGNANHFSRWPTVICNNMGGDGGKAVMQIVRRQGFCDEWQPDLAEALADLVVVFRWPLYNIASAADRWSWLDPLSLQLDHARHCRS